MNRTDIANLVNEINSFTPCIRKKDYRRLTFVVQRIVTVSRRHFIAKEQFSKVIEALLFAAENHKGVRRKDDITPYILHPLEVVLIIFSMDVYDFKLTIAGILHDVYEDTDATRKEIRVRFGDGSTCIVYLVTKRTKRGELVKVGGYWKALRTYPVLSITWRAILLKFADRIHNVRTFKHLPINNIAKKIAETLNEFPRLEVALEKTIQKLHEKGVIHNEHYLKLHNVASEMLYRALDPYLDKVRDHLAQ